jgi:hypothetical protein
VPQANPKVLTLAPGRVLLASRQLAAGGPDAITGFDAASGTLTFQANVTVVSGVIHIPAAEVVQLDAVLETPPAPASGAGPGADARAVTASLPASITLRFKETGGEITELPDFGVTVYGTALTLSRNNAAPTFDPGLRQILVPANVTQASFSIAQDLSTLLVLSGSAPVTGGAWALPVMNFLPPPGAVLGAGNVEIVCGAGIDATWTGITQTTAAQTAVIFASPGQVGVVLQIQTTIRRNSCFFIALSPARKHCRSPVRQRRIWTARCGPMERAFRFLFRPARRRSCSARADCN